jgi:hypothetical protein
MASVLLAGCIVSAPKSCRDPKPHTWFYLKDGEQVWRVTVRHEDELAITDTLVLGDALSVAWILERGATVL